MQNGKATRRLPKIQEFMEIPVDYNVEDDDDPLATFLALKQAAVARGLIPEGLLENEPPPPPPPPPLKEEKLIALDGTLGDEVLDGPWTVAFLGGDELLVTERKGRVVVLSALGEGLRRELPLPEDVLEEPQGTACDIGSRHLYLADGSGHSVHKVKLPDAAPCAVVRGKELPSVDMPTDATDPSRAMAAMMIQDEEMPPLEALRYPRGCTIEGDELFVCDSGHRRVLSYDVQTLAPRRAIGWTRPMPLFAGPHAARPHAHVAREEGLECPVDVCTLNGELYVCDAHNHRIVVYELSTGAFLRALGRRGSQPGELQSPFGVLAVGDRLVVSDATRVQVLQPDGTPNQVLAIADAESLAGMCSDGRYVYVADCSFDSGCVYRLRILSSPEEANAKLDGDAPKQDSA